MVNHSPLVIVLGSVNVDLVIRGERLPAPGETVVGGAFFQAQGGKGANQAVAAARLAQQPVAFLAAVGDDAFGEAARASLLRENLLCDHIRMLPRTATGVALILVDRQGQNLISVASGANAALGDDALEQAPDAWLSSAKVFLASLETPLSGVARALAHSKRAGLTTILNPAPADRALLSGEVLPNVDLLTPNETEAALLTGAAVCDLATAQRAAEKLLAAGCGNVIVTLGSQGCLVATPQGATAIPARPVQAVDATAAGDAFNGALAVALAEGADLITAARWATHAAALSVTRPGAQPSLPTRAEIMGVMEHIGRVPER